MRGLVGLVVLAALLFGLLMARGASAQYPPPGGSLTAGTSNSTPAVSASTEITGTVRDLTGNPVAGVQCNFAIVSEPGSDAEIGSKSTTKTTNAQGIATATLKVGSTAGTIVVRVTCGSLQADVLAVAKVASPPAAPVDLSPPSTGDGGLVR